MRLVTFYRLEAGLTHVVRVPDYGVLNARTVARLAKALGYPGDPGREGQISDCPQLHLDGENVVVVEVDPDPGGEIGRGSIALRFRPCTAHDAAKLSDALRAAIGRRLDRGDVPDAAEDVAEVMLRKAADAILRTYRGAKP